MWSFELLPHPDPAQQTVLVVIAPRDKVEEQLTALEQSGFVADRLAVPLAGQLRELPAGDGLWVLAEDGGTVTHFLLAWRVNKVWLDVSMATIPQGGALAGVVEPA